jgi:hypothetical protein
VNLARHGRFDNAVSPKVPYDLPDLSQSNPIKTVADRRQLWVGMVLDAQAKHLRSVPRKRLGHETRKASPAGNQADFLGRCDW